MEYDPLTGLWRWVRTGAGRYKKGWFSGCKNAHGYRVIRVDGRLYAAHRLAWLYENGSWPVNHIDHINGDRSDNRAINLREATHAENLWNRSATRSSKTGVKGVHVSRNKYVAAIQANNKQVRLGSFETLEEASMAVADASAQIHGEYRRA